MRVSACGRVGYDQCDITQSSCYYEDCTCVLIFRRHAVARPKPSPSPSPSPSRAATLRSTPSPAVPVWPSSAYRSTYQSSLSNSGMFGEFQASECTMGKVVGIAACVSLWLCSSSLVSTHLTPSVCTRIHSTTGHKHADTLARVG